MSILYFKGECNGSSDKQYTEDILRSEASFFMQIEMEDNVFKTKKNYYGISCEWNFSVKLSRNKVNQMSILLSGLLLDESLTSLGYSGILSTQHKGH